METFNLSNVVDFKSFHLSEDWQLFEQQMKNYLLATEKMSKLDNVKIAIVLNALRSEGLHVFNMFKLPEDTSYDDVLNRFRDYRTLVENLIYHHYVV